MITALTAATDTAINYVLDNPTQIANFSASDVQIPDSVPVQAHGAINTALTAIEDRVQQPDVQNALSAVDTANQVYETGMTHDYDALSLSAGVFVEAGNAVKDVEFAGMQFKQVDYFIIARTGLGATLYDMGNGNYYGCYGPEASVGAGIRAHFNENVAGVARIDHDLGLDGQCVGGVTQERDPQTSVFIGLEIPLWDDGQSSAPRTGKGDALMSF